MSYSGAKVLITGGLGFIGSNLARDLLGNGAEVTLVDSLIPEFGGNLANVEDLEGRKGLRINVSDVRDSFSLKTLIKDKDFLFNLAGQTSHLDSMTDPFTDLEINSKAQLSILEACREANPKIRIVFASTRQLYGKPNYLPVDERHPIQPVDVNGINKLSGEWYHILYHRVYGIRSCALRLINTYGPGMRIKDARQTFLGIWIRNLLEGKPIKVFGDGLQLRDFNYVSDVVNGMMSIALREDCWGEIYNMGGSERIGLKALAEMMIQEYGKGAMELVVFPPERKAIDIGDYYSDFTKINEAIGWSPSVSLREGLKRTMHYYQRSLDKYL